MLEEGKVDQTAGSPWDEPLPENEKPQTSAPTVVGDLDARAKQTAETASATESQENAQPASLKVPVDTEEKVGVKIDASKAAGVTELITPKPTEAASPPRQVPIQTQAKPQESSENFWQSVYGQQADIQKPSAPSVQPSQTVPRSIPVQSVVSPKPTSPPKQQVPLVENNQKPIQPAPHVQNQAPKTNPSLPKPSKTTGYIIAAAVGILILFSGSIFLTEYGLISLGLEKVYGAVHLEALWDGLPANAENAFLMSAAKVKSEQNFKVEGSAELTVNKGVKSEIISPIVASSVFPAVVFKDESVGKKILATLAATESQTEGVFEESTDDTTTTDPIVDSSSVTSDTSGTSSSSTSGAGTSTTSATTTVEELELEISSAITDTVSGADIKVKSNKSQNSSISLINSDSNLFVKTSSDIVYNSTVKTGWTKIDLKSSFEGKAKENFFGNSFSSSDFSIVGQRSGSEKIGGVRCFHYTGKVSVGNSLNNFGIESSGISSFDIDYWLGIKDHLIYKIELKIIPGSQSAVTRIDSTLNFSDYNEASGEYSIPTASVPYAPATNSTNVNLETEKGRDSQRKSDLANIAQALETYHSASGRYPQVTGTAKISDQSGALFNALVPTYIRTLPIDPQDPKYYYGYVSDGNTFKLSGVLEDKTDTQGKVVGNLLIYYLSSL